MIMFATCAFGIIDFLIMLAMFAGWLLIALFVLICIGVITILRWWFRSIEEPDERVSRHAPSVQRDIANLLRREYPNRRPAEFV